MACNDGILTYRFFNSPIKSNSGCGLLLAIAKCLRYGDVFSFSEKDSLLVVTTGFGLTVFLGASSSSMFYSSSIMVGSLST